MKVYLKEVKLTSPAFEMGGEIPSLFTCQGENISPPLMIQDVPPGAICLVLLMDDPDVPSSVRADQMWDHWVVYNIPPETKKIEEGKAPVGSTEGKNTGGKNHYIGPCPPDREHRYFFKLYALSKKLSLGPGATKQQVEKAIEGAVLAECYLMGRYEKH